MSPSATIESDARLSASSPPPGDVYSRLWATRQLPGDARLLAACQEIAKHFDSPYLAIQLQTVSRTIDDELFDGKIPVQTWRAMASGPLLDALTANRPSAPLFREQRHDISVVVLAVPVRDGSGEVVGAIALVASSASAEVAQAQ